jgi:hypothetical protein
MFLMFVFECLCSLSLLDELDDNFWNHLEQKIGNGISIEDESFAGGDEEDSLFGYLEEQLKPNQDIPTGGQDDPEILMKRAKLIYLLQNYKYL